MLYEAGRLTLELAIASLKAGFGLKDATPYNILFDGPNAVFIDVLSFERRTPGDYIWLPYAQFLRTFALPLLVHKYFNLSLTDIFLSRRDGLEPGEVYHFCSLRQKLTPPFLTMATLPKWLAGRHNEDDRAIYEKKLLPNAGQAQYILSSLLKRLQKSFRKLAPQEGKKSAWSDYMESNNNYSRMQLNAKITWIEKILNEHKPEKVLDIGCNTGVFSMMAARSGAKVVAIDYDPVVIGTVWRNAKQDNLDILPLVVNITRPSPSAGWLNREYPSFLERAQNNFDMIFMLAVIHHMLVGERIPLPQIIELASKLTNRLAVIEYVDPADSMFRRLTRGRDYLYTYFNRGFFEETCSQYFDIVEKAGIQDSNRCLYLLRKKEA